MGTSDGTEISPRAMEAVPVQEVRHVAQLQPDGALLDEPAAVGQSVERRGERADLLAEILEQLLATAERSSRFPAHKQDNITRTASCQPPDLANLGETKPGEPLDLPDPAALWGLGAVARAPAAAP